MWEAISNFFTNIYGSVNDWIRSVFQFDQVFMDLYNQFIVPLPELIKILGAGLLAIIIVLGVISFVKKMLKLFVVIAVILAIVFLVTQLT